MVLQVGKRPPVKADLAIYSLIVGMSGQWENVATILNIRLDFHCYDNSVNFCKSSQKCKLRDLQWHSQVSSFTSLAISVKLPYSGYNLRGAIFANHQISHLAVIFAIIKLANHCMYRVMFLCGQINTRQSIIDISIISAGCKLVQWCHGI